MKSNLIDDRARRRIRLSQLSNVFARADSALAGRRVSVNINPVTDPSASGTPAFTQKGNDITIRELPGHPAFTSTKGLVVANGLNYHELCHVMFTPMDGTYLYRSINARGLGASYNVLEDQRIEGIMTTRFTTTKHYLTATVAEYFLNPTDQDLDGRDADEFVAESWPIVYGRRYLPSNMRDHFRKESYNRAGKYPFPWTTKDLREIESIVDEYIALRFGRVITTALHDKTLDLVQRYHDLMAKNKRSNPNPFGHGSVIVVGNGGDQGAPGGDAQSKGGDKGDQSQGGDDGDDAKGGGDAQGSDDPASTLGSSSQTGMTDDLKGVLSKTLAKIVSDPSVQADTKQQTNVLNTSGNHYNGLLPTAGCRKKAPSPEYRAAAASFRKQLACISADEDPGFDKMRDSGKLNVMRAIKGDSLDTVFDQWQEGKQDAASIELVVLLDRSYSMSSIMENANMAAWALKYGVDGLQGSARCSVITFGGAFEYLYRPNDKAGTTARVINSIGGTPTHRAVSEAAGIFAMSERRKKILISVSDGAWDDPNRSVPIIESMNKAGVVTAALHLIEERMWKNYTDNWDAEMLKQQMDTWRNGHTILVRGDGPNDITRLGKQLVKKAMRS